MVHVLGGSVISMVFTKPNDLVIFMPHPPSPHNERNENIESTIASTTESVLYYCCDYRSIQPEKAQVFPIISHTWLDI